MKNTNKGGNVMKNILNVAKCNKRVVITIGSIAIVISWKKNYSLKVVRDNEVVMEAKINKKEKEND